MSFIKLFARPTTLNNCHYVPHGTIEVVFLKEPLELNYGTELKRVYVLEKKMK